MARPIKKGLDYFPHDVDFFEKEEIKFFSVECGASGICALIKLKCNIFRNGYYIEWSQDHEALFGWDMRGMVAKDEIPHIIEVCLKRGIFSEKLYKKYNILTSQEIQEVFLQALDGKRRINIVKEYWLIKIPDKVTITTLDGDITDANKEEVEVVEEKTESDRKTFILPTLDEMKQYAMSKGYSEVVAEKAFNYYEAGNWKDSGGKRVKNWKQKMIAVWFKPEYLKSYGNGNEQRSVTI